MEFLLTCLPKEHLYVLLYIILLSMFSRPNSVLASVIHAILFDFKHRFLLLQMFFSEILVTPHLKYGNQSGDQTELNMLL